ncbi:MAG: hypothetical protein ACK41Q_01005 [Candidatus Brocadia sp.]
MANTDCFDIFKKLPYLLFAHYNYFCIKLFLHFRQSHIPDYTDGISVLKLIDRASDAATSFDRVMGIDRRRANVFGEDNQRLSSTVLQCQAFFGCFSGKELG